MTQPVQEFKKELSDRTGLNIATGAEACKAGGQRTAAIMQCWTFLVQVGSEQVR